MAMNAGNAKDAAVKNMTKGGLRAATITDLRSEKTVYFMFNPHEYTISKSNNWTTEPAIGRDVPTTSFDHGQARSLTLNLHFDTLETGADVRSLTEPLWKMMMIVQSDQNQRSGKSQPPPVMFNYGRVFFRAIIKQMSETFTLFSEDGVPLRCKMQVSLQEYADDVAANERNVESALTVYNSEATAQAVEAQRLDNILAASGLSPDKYRAIAEKNNLDNPLNIPAGSILRL